jgi:hypothetical protein
MSLFLTKQFGSFWFSSENSTNFAEFWGKSSPIFRYYKIGLKKKSPGPDCLISSQVCRHTAFGGGDLQDQKKHSSLKKKPLQLLHYKIYLGSINLLHKFVQIGLHLLAARPRFDLLLDFTRLAALVICFPPAAPAQLLLLQLDRCLGYLVSSILCTSGFHSLC